METLHIPCFSEVNPVPFIIKNIPKLAGYKRIGLVSTIQHLNRLEEIADALIENDFEVEIGGQVLGCQQHNALKLDVDAILFIGSGRFHPLGIAKKTDKPVYILNPLSEVFDIILPLDAVEMSKKRKAALINSLSKEVFGIMISTKYGQMQLDEAFVLKEKLEAKGRRAYLIAADELSPNNILPIQVEALINTACPRIADDKYHVPVINSEFMFEAIEMMK